MRRLLLCVMLGWTAATCLGGEAPASGEQQVAPQDHLKEILRRPLYQRWLRRQRRTAPEEPGLLRSMREKLDEWRESLKRALSRRISRSGGPSGSGGPSTAIGVLPRLLKALGYLAVAVAVVFLAFIAYRLVRDWQRGGPQARILSREQVREALETGAALALGGPQWLDQAARLTQEGDLRAVYRALYLALLSGLHERGKIDFRRNRTNWTYVRRFHGAATERDTFASLTALFDRVWYGCRPPPGSAIGGLQHSVANLLKTGAPRA